MPLSSRPPVRGLVLAAGSGSRMGRPKALIRPRGDGPTLVGRAVEVLVRGGCEGVTVVVGAAADEVVAVLGEASEEVDIVRCEDWSEGMGASLRAGLTALTLRSEVEAVLIGLVDLPDVGPPVVRRLLDAQKLSTRSSGAPPSPIEWTGSAAWRSELSRAAYGGVPGHPTLIGRDHWAGVIKVAQGDRGARDYFRAHEHRLVECGDLATGRDVDTPADLDR
ncbi:MAG TPA: nucleotidyltransferase family protein [Intrasporangium sp.]|nr:nucleotidyltransferase family protein [Intrasporangium sp.]